MRASVSVAPLPDVITAQLHVVAFSLMNSTASLSEPTDAPAKPHSMPGPAKSFISNILAVLSGQLSCAVVALAVQVCYARLLGPSGRGQISLALMVIAFGGLLGGVGGEIPLVTWTAAAKGKRLDWLASVMWTGTLGSCLVIALGGLVYWKFNPSFLKGLTPALIVIALLSVPINIFVSYCMALLAGLEQFRLRAGLALGNQFLGLGGVVALALIFGKTPEFALLGSQLGMLLVAVVTALCLRETLHGAWDIRLAGKDFLASLSLGLRGMFGNLATFFNYRLDVFVVNYFLDTTQVGLYAVGVLVSEALWQIPHAAAVALFPRTARTIEDGATEFTCLVLRQVLLIAGVSGAVMAVLSPIVIPLLFGARFAHSVAVIWWLLPGAVALSAAKVISVDLTARGWPEFPMGYAFATLIATVSFDLLLIPRMGIRGAALASSIAYCVDSLLLLITLKYKLRITWQNLLVPTAMELDLYRQAWLRCRGALASALGSTQAVRRS